MVGAEEEIESVHPDGGVGYVSIFNVEVNPLWLKRFSFDHAAEVDPVALAPRTVTVGGQEDMLTSPRQGRLHVLFVRVEVIDGFGLAERGRFFPLLGTDPLGEKDIFLPGFLAVGREVELVVIGGDRGSVLVLSRIDSGSEGLDLPALFAAGGNIQVVAA